MWEKSEEKVKFKKEFNCNNLGVKIYIRIYKYF